MKRTTALLFTAVFVLSLWGGAGVCLAQGDFGEAAAGEIMPGGAESVMPGIPADLDILTDLDEDRGEVDALARLAENFGGDAAVDETDPDSVGELTYPDSKGTDHNPVGQNQQARLSDGRPGQGTISDPDKYWAQIGYPEDVAFAFEAGGEVRKEDGQERIYRYWEIGLVGADEARRQEILKLIAPDCLVTFRDSRFSYARREAALEEILADKDARIARALMSRNTDFVTIIAAGEDTGELAKEMAARYGELVVVAPESAYAEESYSLGLDGADPGGGIAAGTRLGLWRTAVLAAGLLGFGGVFFARRRGGGSGMAMAEGGVISPGRRLSRRRTVELVRQSGVLPRPETGELLWERLRKEQALPRGGTPASETR